MWQSVWALTSQKPLPLSAATPRTEVAQIPRYLPSGLRRAVMGVSLLLSSLYLFQGKSTLRACLRYKAYTGIASWCRASLHGWKEFFHLHRNTSSPSDISYVDSSRLAQLYWSGVCFFHSPPQMTELCRYSFSA